jgi:putative Ca2+/H+ antiporter (TMEM165/GDT1 family)
MRGTVLFGAFAAYAVVDLASAVHRHAVKSFTPTARHDAIAIVAGVALALVVMTFHRALFGAVVAPFGR